MSRLLLVSPYPPPADGIGAHSEMLATALRDRFVGGEQPVEPVEGLDVAHGASPSASCR